jgi:hypothetical protein
MEEKQTEEILYGGNTSVVVRVGDTVRRHTGHWTPAVHDLLAHLSSVGFVDAPTVLGIDDQSREVLPFVTGEVGLLDPVPPLPTWFRTTEACIATETGCAGSTALRPGSRPTRPCHGGWSRGVR